MSLSKKQSRYKGSSRIFCKSKTRIYDLKLFIDYLELKGIRIRDWWDEDDKYCFETE
jgi:hypothetical protein